MRLKRGSEWVEANYASVDELIFDPAFIVLFGLDVQGVNGAGSIPLQPAARVAFSLEVAGASAEAW